MRGSIWLSSLAALALGGVAHATNDCTNSGWRAHASAFDDQLAQMTCQSLTTTPVSGVSFHVVQDSAHPEADAQAITSLVTSSAQTALDKYKTLNGALGYHDVTVVLSPYTRTDNILAAATPDLNNECLLVVFTATDSVKNPTRRAVELPNTVAHELFHCVQYWTDPQQAAADGHGWWAEGSAEVMAQSVFDVKEDYNTLNDQFQITTKPLTQLDYPAYVFFAWLLQARGPAAIFPFMAAMPTASGEAAQRAALLAQVTPAELNTFAETWVDGRITTPQGWKLLPPSAVDRTQTFADSDTKQWPTGDGAGPFTMQWGQAKFQNGRFALTATDELSPAAHFSLASGIWADVPSQVGAPCGTPPVLKFAGFNTKDAAVHTTLKATRDASVVTGALPDHDSCLNGTWVLDATAVENKMNASIPDANPKPVVNGGVTLNLPSGGAGMDFTFDDYDAFVGTDAPVAENTEVEVTGGAHGSWSSSNATHTLRLCSDMDNVVLTSTVQVFSAAGTVTDVQTLTGASFADSTYTCTASQLIVSVPTTNPQAPAVTVYKRPGTPDSAPTGSGGSSAPQSKGCTSAPGDLVGFVWLLALARRRRA